MEAATNPTAAERLRGAARRYPAVPVAVAFACGIALDRWLGLSWGSWIGLGGLAAAGWIAAAARGTCVWSAGLLLAACLCLGGARHHLFWSVGRADDVSLFATAARKPVRIVGRLASAPVIQAKRQGSIAPAWPQFDKSVCLLKCRSIATGTEDRPVSGVARLSVTGHLLHVDVGDEIEVRGWIARPRGPSNPGDFDFAESVRRRGARCVVSANDPESVRCVRRAGGWSPRRTAARLRHRAETVLARHLSPRSLPVASAMLIGNRSHMTDEIRDAFVESGTMHVLAISGLHVGILALFVWICCRLFNLSPATGSVVVVLVIAAYAAITDARPSVVRAAIMISVLAAGRPWHRRSAAANSLAVAALAVLLWNPSDLFDTGPQLSFLAVTGILWAGSGRVALCGEPESSADGLPLQEAGWARRGARRVGDWLWESHRIMFAVWLFTAPLIAARFHLVSPVGLVVNVLLVSVVTVVLWLGYGLLACGFLLPWLAPVCGAGFDGGLLLVVAIVERAAAVRLSHLYVSGPAGWWLAGYYALLAAMLAVRVRPRLARWTWRGFWAWAVVGLAVGLVPSRPQGLRCTFLSVGHGLAVLVEFPNGRTLLYDAGSLQDSARAAGAVRAALWDRRLSQIDAVIVSHADVDHFNALPEVLQTVPAGQVLVARSFLDFRQQPVVQFCEAARQRGVPVTLISAGDQVRLDEGVSIRVRHPSLAGHADDDNANSIVLEIEYAGRRILLTGDLENDGLWKLIGGPPRKADVMLAPHHGSAKANPPELAAWARPGHVIISGSRPGSLPKLQSVYGTETQVTSTILSGAVTIEIEPDGSLRRLCPFERTGRADAIE